MGLAWDHPISMGNKWNFTKYVAIPYGQVSYHVWDWYGTIPYHSHTRSYGEHVELYEIRSNPIGKDNRMLLNEDSHYLWV